MPDPMSPYEFPATLYIYHWPGAPGVSAPDVETLCQWRAFDDPRNFGFGGYTSSPRGFVELLVPYGVDIREAANSTGGAQDLISVTDTADHVYQVLWVEVIYRGFPRQCYKVVARRLTLGLDQPVP